MVGWSKVGILATQSADHLVTLVSSAASEASMGTVAWDIPEVGGVVAEHRCVVE